MPELTNPVIPSWRWRSRKQPTLTVDELTLRPWQLSDAAALVVAYVDPEIQQWHARSMTDQEARDWVTSWTERWTAGTGVGWAVVTNSGLVGRMGFGLSLKEGSAEAAYWTMPAARGGDIAARALRAASTWLLTVGGLHRLEVNHSTQNPASCRVATKVGYAYEGTKRRQALHPDGWHDMHLHALLAEDLDREP